MSNDRTYTGDVISNLENMIDDVNSKTRKQPRSVQQEESPMYWYPRYQEWMTLSQYEYRKTLDKLRKAK